jgi:hypothetical protein
MPIASRAKPALMKARPLVTASRSDIAAVIGTANRY